MASDGSPDASNGNDGANERTRRDRRLARQVDAIQTSAAFPPGSRRQYLRLVGAAGLTALAGCAIGGDGSGSGDGSDGGDGSGSGGGTNTSPENGEWPDLSGQEVHVLTDESNDPVQTNYWDPLKADFEAATGATVNMEYGGLGTSIEERLTQLAQAGDPPEIFIAGSGRIALYTNQGLTAPVTDAVEGIEEMFSEEMPEENRYIVDGEDYMIPQNTATKISWHRPDIGGELPEKPTWDEFLEWAEGADDPSGIRGTYVPVGGGFCPDTDILSWAYSNGTKMAGRDGNGEVQIVMTEGDHRDRWLETLEYLRELYQYSAPATDSTCGTLVQVVPGEVAASSRYGAGRPKIQSIVQDKPFARSLSNTVQPKPPNGTHRTWQTKEGMITFQGADTEAAQAYMQFALQKKYQMGFFSATPGLALHAPSPWKSIKNSEEYQNHINNELPEEWKDADKQTILVDSVEDTMTIPEETDPPNPYSGQLLASNHITDMVFDVCVNERSPGEALDEWSQALQDVLNQAKSG